MLKLYRDSLPRLCEFSRYWDNATGQDVHVDITGGEHEHHAGAYHHHQQQVPAHGDDAAYAAMNADLMAPKACRWVAIANQRSAISRCLRSWLYLATGSWPSNLSGSNAQHWRLPHRSQHPAASRDGRFNCRCASWSSLSLGRTHVSYAAVQRQSAGSVLIACLLSSQQQPSSS